MLFRAGFRLYNQVLDSVFWKNAPPRARKRAHIMLIMRTHVKREPCRRCQILRVFLLMVLGIAVIGFTMTEMFSQIGGIPPILFGWLFAGLAVLTFAVKYAFYQRRKQATDLSDES